MFFILFLLWLIFNGRVTFEIVWIGVLVCGAIYLLCWKFFGYSPRRDLRILKKTPLIIRYLCLLVIEICKANFTVVKMILSRREVHPVLVEFEADLKTSTARAVLSHSITLTPGTITVELKGDTFAVHCLDSSLAEGIEDSEFIRLLKKMEA